MWICVDGRVLQDYPRGGVQAYAKQLLAAIFSLDRENKYLIFYNSFGAKKETPNFSASNVFEVCFGFPNKIFNFSLAAGFWPELDTLIESAASKQLKEKVKIDIFWAPNINFIKLRKETKLFLTIHDLSFLVEPAFFRVKERLWHAFVRPAALFARADKLLPVSAYTLSDLLKQGIPEGKCEVIYPGISEQFFSIKPERVKEVKKILDLPERFILTLAASGRRKNMEAVIAAYSAARLPENMHLVVAGYGTENLGKGSPRHLSESRNVGGMATSSRQKIIFLGAVHQDLLPALYAAADFFVYPSSYEGFGLPALEAMAAGTPVIVSSATSLPEVAGGAGIMVDPHDRVELSRAMETLAGSAELRKDLASRGVQAARRYSWESSAGKLIKLFEQ